VIFLISIEFEVEFFKTNYRSDFLSQFQKKNHPNRSSGSEDIVDLKSVIVLGFS
jgi:hypothetical protein